MLESDGFVHLRDDLQEISEIFIEERDSWLLDEPEEGEHGGDTRDHGFPGFASDDFEPLQAEFPVKFLQGTWGKVLAMRDRAEKGQELWHPLDSDGSDDEEFESFLQQIKEMQDEGQEGCC